MTADRRPRRPFDALSTIVSDVVGVEIARLAFMIVDAANAARRDSAAAR